MRKVILFSLLILVTACTESSNGTVDIREPEGSGSVVVENPTGNVPSGVEKLIYHIGPVDLLPGMTAKQNAEKPLVMSFQVDSNKWLIGFEPSVIDEKGNKLPPELLHQAIIVNNNEENPLCPIAGNGNPFIASSSLLNSIKFPNGYAYPILSNDPLEAQIILKNESDTAYSNVYFEVVLLVRSMDAMADFKNLRPVFFEQNPCSHIPPDLPPEGLIEKDVEIKTPISGNMVMALGLLQDYGAQLSLINPEDGQSIWRMSASIDAEHKLVELIGNPFEDPAGIPIQSGKPLTLRYSYDNSTDGWINLASAGALLYLADE